MAKKLFLVLSAIVLIVAGLVSANEAQAQSCISISPTSGHWNYPGSFLVVNNCEEPVEVHWLVDCWDEIYCQDRSGVTTLAHKQGFTEGAGNICEKWQLDLWWPGGSWGGIAEINPDCYEPTPTAPPPTSTPTSTPTPTDEPTPEHTPTPQPTPENTPTPEPTPEVTPTPSTPVPPEPVQPVVEEIVEPTPEPTEAPFVPQAGIGDISHDGFEEIGSVTLSDREMPLYEGRVENGQVSIARYGITEYNDQYWVHRIQNWGWIRFQEGDIVAIKGVNYRLVAMEKTQGYEFTTDQLPTGILVSCYALGDEWSGLELFRLVKIVPPRRDMIVAQ